MSEREGLYCEKHVKFWAGGVCEDCVPADSFAFWRSGPAKPMEPGELQRQMSALWVKMRERTTDRDLTAEQAAYGVPDCDHANGYCKDTAHKYELPVE